MRKTAFNNQLSRPRLTCCARHSCVRPMGDKDAFGKLELELRRGVVVLAAISQLQARFERSDVDRSCATDARN